ncbi:MAG: type II secretion system protein GspG [Pontiellaceae bacterium]|nr:type II secretion system protein GspG [Pontiellaceae bacterium]
MKRIDRFVLCCFGIISLLFTASCYRLDPHEQSTALRMEKIEQAEVPLHPHERFIALMKLLESDVDPVLNGNYILHEKVIEVQNEIDRLYYRIVSMGDVEAFQTIIEFDSRIAGCTGVFGLMEIANRDDLYSPRSKELRRECLDLLAKYTAHSNPDIRGVALYALGEMQLPEYKDLFISHLSDDTLCHVEFPPLIMPSGLGSDVRTLAGIALRKTIGAASASGIINEVSNEIAATKRTGEELLSALYMYKVDAGRYPASMDELMSRRGQANWKGPYMKPEDWPAMDSWGTPFRYQLTGEPPRATLLSAGLDKEFGTSDDLIYAEDEQ